MLNKVNQLKLGTILSYLQMALSIIIGVAYTPIMLRLLGQSEYGLYNTVSSTISLISILSLGLNSGYVRYYSKYKTNKDIDSIYKLNGLFLIIFSIIGIIAFLCGMFLSANLNLVFDDGLTTQEYKIAKSLMILLTINLSISFPMGVFSHIISANERFVFLKLMGMLKTVLSPLLTLPLLLMGYRSIAMVSVTLLIAIVTDITYCVYVFKVLKYRFVFHDFEKGIFKNLFVYTSFIALDLIIEQLNSNVDKIIISRYLGAAATAVYSIGHSLYVYYCSFSTAISNVFTPRIHKIVNETKNDKDLQRFMLTDIFVRVGRIQFVVLSLIVTGLVFFGQNFIKIWAGEGYSESYYIAILLFVPATIALTQNLGIAIQRAENNHQYRSVIYFIMAVCNVILTIFLTPKFGVIGATIGTAISLIIGNGFLMNIFYYKRCNINIFEYWKNIFKVSKGLILPVALGFVFKGFLNSLDSIVTLALGIVVYSAIYVASMWLFGLNEYEKSLIIKPIRKLLKK